MLKYFWSVLLLGALAAASNVEAADGWGIDKERIVQLNVTVVDLACELGRSCPPECGGGKRQLGIKLADGKLYPVAKGGTLFAGGVVDLLPYCGKSVSVDGLLIESPVMQLFFAQNLRDSPNDKWRPADAFERQWTAEHGKADEWMRADPTVKKVIEEDGILGIKGLTVKK